jgi:hypothetical protein
LTTSAIGARGYETPLALPNTHLRHIATDSKLYNNDFVDLEDTGYATLAEDEGDEVEVPNAENEHCPLEGYLVQTCVASNSREVTSSNIVLEKVYEQGTVNTEPIEEHVLVPEVGGSVLPGEDEPIRIGDANMVKHTAFKPPMSNTTKFWLTLLLVLFMDYFSLGLLSNFVRNPVLSITFIVVLLMYNGKDNNEQIYPAYPKTESGSQLQLQADPQA